MIHICKYEEMPPVMCGRWENTHLLTRKSFERWASSADKRSNTYIIQLIDK